MSYYSKKISILIVSAILSFAFSAFLSMMLLKNNEDIEKAIPMANLARIKVNPTLEFVRKNFDKIGRFQEVDSILKHQLKRMNSKVKIVDLNGLIIFDSEGEKSAQGKVNLEEMVYNHEVIKKGNPVYTELAFPIIISETQIANAIFLIPAKDLSKNSNLDSFSTYIPIKVGLVLSIIVLLILYISLFNEILKPIKRLNHAVSIITRGDLDFELESYARNEVGELSRAFERMRIELKNSLEYKDKLERERKELVASISHEIKTPLSSIKAYAEGLRDGIAESIETSHKYINVIISKTDGIVKLVNDLLQHSMQDLGNFEIRKEEVYSRQLLLNIIEPIRLKMGGKPVSLELEGDIPNVLIEVDTSRIEQVLINLIQNAEKYALGSEGKIKVSTVLEDDCLLVSISDNGSGIPPEELPFIFNRFYRGSKSKSLSIEGVGLGLSICKYIIEEHGGIIFAESIQNKGSIFRFTIPKI